MAMHWIQPIYVASDMSATLPMVDEITNQIMSSAVARGQSRDKVRVSRGSETILGSAQNLVVERLALWYY